MPKTTLSPREQAVKRTLLEELGRNLWPDFNAGVKETLSYAEHKHLSGELDAEFVAERLRVMERRNHWLRRGLIALFLLVLLVPALSSLLWGAESFSSQLLLSTAAIVLFALGTQAALSLSRRITIYRALQVLAIGSAEVDTAPSPTRVVHA